MSRRKSKQIFFIFVQSVFHFCTKSIAITKNEYSFLKKDLFDYIQYFGHPKDILFTPYFHISIIASFIIVFLGSDSKYWAEIALSALPDILGFSIGGYAIIITFGDEKFRKFLVKTEIGNKKPLLLIINGTFIHFILCQTLAIFLAYILSSIDIENKFINFIFSIPFSYSLLFCIAIAFEIKTISSWYRSFLKRETEKNTLKNSKAKRPFPRKPPNRRP